MSRIPENDIRNDIYENLPCHAMYNESVRKIKTVTSSSSSVASSGAAAIAISSNEHNNSNVVVLNNCNQSSGNNSSSNSCKKTTNQLPPKEHLYATPLRKSDRYKSGERYRNNKIHTEEIAEKCEKLYNVEYKLINKDNLLLKNGGGGSGGGSSRGHRHTNRSIGTSGEITEGFSSHASGEGRGHAERSGGIVSSSCSGLLKNNTHGNNLEDRRILNFLKDTTQVQKKIEIGKDCPNASFSCLAREEHFANLVQQNFTVDSSNLMNNDYSSGNGGAGNSSDFHGNRGEDGHSGGDGGASEKATSNKNNLRKGKSSEETTENLEVFMDKKQSPDKEIVNEIAACSSTNYAIRTHNVYINREWVLKKIALCLEQRMSNKKIIPGLPPNPTTASLTKTDIPSSNNILLPRPSHHASCGGSGLGGNSYHGCLVLGSNGSGKTSICEAIMNGNTGTRGLLNRKLLACYFVNSQNPDCHSLSIFIRSMVLQILSHSSLIGKPQQQQQQNYEEKETSPPQDGKINEKSKPNLEFNNSVDDNTEQILNDDEIKFETDINGKNSFEQSNPNDIDDEKNSSNNKKIIIRQKSAPSPEKKIDNNESKTSSYSTHPPKSIKSTLSSDITQDNIQKDSQSSSSDNYDNNNKPKSSPGKKSKIPIAITNRVQQQKSNNDIQQGGGEDYAADLIGEELKNEIEAELNDDIDDDDDDDVDKDCSGNNVDIDDKIARTESQTDEIDAAAASGAVAMITQPEEENSNKEQKIKTSEILNDNIKDKFEKQQQQQQQQYEIPPPLPKPKSCRTIIADSYYEMIIGNPEIFECLNVDNIEKNPDECFKKALLFPLLELTPPRNALLLLIDSIDENYINEGNLISTLKGRSCNEKSNNIAELLSNHIHLFPKWLFFVFTTKKQTKYITKMFNGFKKITLDDLRKSHVVKDVQEYIINRLNTDFKGSINLTKEIIESLHQLYIKSNGCILYLEKVLNGIKDNFFSFREIKLIPCTLNGLYLYICQKSFNKKQYLKIRPILNILLASIGYIDKIFLFNCLRMHNYTIDYNEYEKRLNIMKNIIIYDDTLNKIKIFHNSFSDWLVDVKFATKKFICDVNEGHIMISMYYTLISDTLCANNVRRFIYHLIKSGEYLTNKNINLDLILILLESRINLNDCFYTNYLNCCSTCEIEYKNESKFLTKTRDMIERFLLNELNEEFSTFLCDFFKPSLPTDGKILKLLIETGINNADSQVSCGSLNSLNSPDLSDKSQNIDFELADLLLSSEKNCQQDIHRPKNSSDKGGGGHLERQDDNTTTFLQLSDSRIEMHKGKALIHMLANDGNHIILNRALNACKGPIDLEIEDFNGQTALNIAARNGHLEVVKILLNFTQPLNDGTGRMKHVDVNHADRDGWTPLRSASWGGHTEVVKLLIAHPGCLIDLADKEGRTALRAAAWSGHEDILKFLIEAGADVNSVDRQGRTSLIAASYMGHYDIVEILLENGADVNHLDLDGRSALCVAALCGSSGYSKVISTLLEHGANTDQLDHDGMSPLLVSSFEGNAEICELLLENGADPDLTDFMGRTPLWAACTAGHANVVKLLLFWGCGIDCMDSEGRTVLSIAAAQGNVETVRQLLDRGLDETHRDNAGWTPLHYAAFEGFHDVCVQLLESGAKIDECDNEGKTALHLAAQEGRQKCVQALLEIHNTFVDQKAHDGKTAFRLACLEGYIDCIQTLLKFGCDFNCKDADSRTTLYILALENKLEIVKYLLDVTDVDVNIPDSEGRTALHVAAWQGHTEMVKLLITRGNANVNAMDLECRTPLHSCAWQGNHEVMELLLYFGALSDHACKQGATALGISAQEGHEKCVAILLKYGANPYKSDHCGRTPIKLAAKSNRNNIIKIFETYTKTNESNIESSKVHHHHHHSNILKSPDDHSTDRIIQQQQQQQQHPFGMAASGHHSHHNSSANHLVSNNNNIPLSVGGGSSGGLLNASNSTHSSNFYENTMQSDSSSLQKRKSVISSQSTGSSNEAPLSFTQQLQRHTKLNSRNNPFIQNTPITSTKYSSKHFQQHQKHSQLLPDLNEYQINAANVTTNEADMFDMECMSPLYATPPHSPSSELSSPGQLSSTHPFEEIGGSGGASSSGIGGGNSNNSALNHHHNQKTSSSSSTDHHFARDTHMRVILGNCKDSNHSSGKSKRSGIATNPAMRMIRSRFDSAANLIRRTNNILNISSNSNQGSSSIGVKSGTFQWRKESQM